MLPQNFTSRAQEIIQESYHKSIHTSTEMESLHVLDSLLEDEGGFITSLLQRLNINPPSLRIEIAQAIEMLPKVLGLQPPKGPFTQIYLTYEMANILTTAQKEAAALKDEYISVEHLLLGLLKQQTNARRLLEPVGVAYESALAAMKELRGQQREQNPEAENHFPALERFTVNLTRMAQEKKLDPVIGRNAEIRRVMQVLSRRTKNNPVLIGEAGTGKTAIVEGLAQRIVEGDVPEGLKAKEIIRLDLGALVAGTKFRGEFEDRLKAVMKELVQGSPRFVVFIDELHTLVGAGAIEGALDASNMLKPALARGELRAIGATTLREYQKYIEKDLALERRFQPVPVHEPSVEETITMLRGLKEKYELHHGVRITDEALVQAAKLSSRYISDRFLPDKAVDLIDEAASALRLTLDSVPPEMDELKRRMVQLEVEREALKKELKIEDSKPKLGARGKGVLARNEESLLRSELKEKLQTIEKELREKREAHKDLEARWRLERDAITHISTLKQLIEDLRQQAEIAERKGDLEHVAEIRYGKIPVLTKELQQGEKKLLEYQKDHKMLKEEVTDEDIAEVVSKWTNIPVSKMLEQEAEKLAHAEQILGKRVIGQEEAITVVANALRRNRANLGEETRPIGSFLFIGPTGVGKTELAKALAEFMFQSDAALMRIDMSEYSEKHSVARFIGSPPGYIGHDEGGQLTEAVRRRPYSVILFDEIEKAHPEVFDMFLQVLDNGRLTDGKGRTVNFNNTIIIMTSNLGTQIIKEYALGFADSDAKEAPQGLTPKEAAMRERVMELMKKTFKPEFLNRLDDTVFFRYLHEAEMKKIVHLQLQRVVQRLLERKGITLKVDENVKQELMKRGFDQNFGARPLQRAIQTSILDKLALEIIRGTIKQGEKVAISERNGDIVVQ